MGMEGVTHHELVPLVPGNLAMMPAVRVHLEDSGGTKNDLKNITKGDKENNKI